jgi:hypothetical protein
MDFLYDLLRIFGFTFDNWPKPLDEALLPENWENAAEFISKKLESGTNSGQIIVLLGEFGCGKSKLISTLECHVNFKKKFKLNYRFSFSSVTNLSEAYLQLISKTSKVFVVIFLAAGTYYFWDYEISYSLFEGLKKNLFSLIFLTGLTTILLNNQFRLLYIFLSFFEFITGFFRKLIIIEDIERSGLTADQIYSFLTHRRRFGVRYLIPFGYHNETSRDNFIEVCLKLNADLITLGPDIDMLYSILIKLLDSNFRIKKGDWLSLFTARKLIRLSENIKHTSTSKDPYVNDLIYHLAFFDSLLLVLNIEVDEIESITTRNIKLRSNDYKMKTFELIDSFWKSIDKDYLVQKHNDKSSSSNWSDNALRELFLRKGQYKELAKASLTRSS